MLKKLNSCWVFQFGENLNLFLFIVYVSFIYVFKKFLNNLIFSSWKMLEILRTKEIIFFYFSNLLRHQATGRFSAADRYFRQLLFWMSTSQQIFYFVQQYIIFPLFVIIWKYILYLKHVLNNKYTILFEWKINSHHFPLLNFVWKLYVCCLLISILFDFVIVKNFVLSLKFVYF